MEKYIPAEKFGQKLKFSGGDEFSIELKRRIDEHLRNEGRKKRDCWQMYLKTAIILAGFAVSYFLLVFVAQDNWQALPMAILLGLSAAGIGCNVQHDGGHKAYSDQNWINKLMAITLDLIGASSYIWHWKHIVIHHTYVNIAGIDKDIDLGMLARLTPHQKKLVFHRWQHIYLWLLYGLLVIKWQFIDDFRYVITGKIGEHQFPRPKGWELVMFAAGKMLFFTWAFWIPLQYHPVEVVIFYYWLVALVMGLMLSMIFQLAHCVEEAQFPSCESHFGRG
jgi:linoleoyl-CoA desaturase